MTQEQKRLFWQQHIIDWQQSGLSQAEYTRRHDLTIKSFSYYKRRYGQTDESVQPSTPAMVPVVLKDNEHEPSQSGIRLVTPQGFRLELTSDFDQMTLRRLLAVLA